MVDEKSTERVAWPTKAAPFFVILATVFVVGAIVLAVNAMALASPTLRDVSLGVIFASTIVVFVIGGFNMAHSLITWRTHSVLKNLFEHSSATVILAKADGEKVFENRAAQNNRHVPSGDTCTDVLAGFLTNPAGEVYRLHTLARSQGFAHEDFKHGERSLRVSVSYTHTGLFLWQITENGPLVFGPEEPVASIPIATIDPQGKVRATNLAFSAQFGSNPRALSVLNNGKVVESGQTYYLDCLTGRQPFQVIFKNMDVNGAEVYFFQANQLKAGDAKEGWDIFERVPVAMIKLTRQGKVITTNVAARKMLGQVVATGTDINALFLASNRQVTDWIEQMVDQKQSQAGEFLRLAEREDDLIIQAKISSFDGEQDSDLILTLNDVTALKSLEAQFVQSQKMQAIGQLAGGVAHDFNNLLTAITGHCDLLLLRHDANDPEYGDLMQIQQNANRAAALVGQLLAFSRKQNLKFQAIEMRDTLADLAHLLNRLLGEKVALVLNHGHDLCPVRADKRQLEQVLMNLVVNARDAMADGGTVTITTKALHLDRSIERENAVIQPGEYVVVEVSDEGCGIRADKMSKIFEPFFTTKKTGEGTGLGLSTVYGIVKQTGGFVFVKSELGQGTTFEVIFPTQSIEPAQMEDTAPVAVTMDAARGNGMVLLVEDEPPVRAFASRALQLKGYKVLEADCGEAALQILEDDEIQVDVFVSDVIMPGMDGPTWVRQALAQRPDTKVVFVSGYAEDCFGDEQPQIENSVFLPKPFSLAQLTNTVHKLIGH